MKTFLVYLIFVFLVAPVLFVFIVGSFVVLLEHLKPIPEVYKQYLLCGCILLYMILGTGLGIQIEKYLKSK